MTPSIPDQDLEAFIDQSGWNPDIIDHPHKMDSMWDIALYKEAWNLYEVMRTSNLIRSDGLLYNFLDGQRNSHAPDIYPDDAISYGMFIDALGLREESMAIHTSLQKAKGLITYDGLAQETMNDQGFVTRGNIMTNTNCQYGILLCNNGDEQYAKRVLDGLKGRNLVRDDNLICTGTDHLGKPCLDVVNPTCNAWYGMLLKATGHDDEAERVHTTIMNTLVSEEGLVMETKHSNKMQLSGTKDHLYYGLLLSSLGKRKEAQGLISIMRDQGFMDIDGLVKPNHMPPVVHRNVYTDHNALYGSLLQSIGEYAQARDVYRCIRKRGTILDDGLAYISSDGQFNVIPAHSNALLGIFLSGRYTSLTGKKTQTGSS